MLPDRPPQVTFSCDKQSDMCHFQFWTAQVESFYCQLSQCNSRAQRGYDKNQTFYECEKIECKCVPGRFICGEDGSLGMFPILYGMSLMSIDLSCLDITDFLRENIKGPAQFICTEGQGCTFEEPGMNDLIETFFGDHYITLQCKGGECLHYSQVPGYVVSPTMSMCL